MAQNCAHCKLRARYDQNPKSLLGRFWRWHINFCPGFKKYFTNLPRQEQQETAMRYNFRKYLVTTQRNLLCIL